VEPLVVVREAFPARGGGVQVAPRIVVHAGTSAAFPVRLQRPDGTTRTAMASLDVAHIRGPNGAFALVRLLDASVEVADPVAQGVWSRVRAGVLA
jgi:hypothetical protein